MRNYAVSMSLWVICAGFLFPAWADDLPVIIPAKPPVMPFDPAGHDIHFINSSAQALGDNFDKLQNNLVILYNLNTKANQETLNKLGATYARLPTLGSDFNAAISSIDVTHTNENSQKLSQNTAEILSNYEAMRQIFGDKMDAIKTNIKASLKPGDDGKNIPTQTIDKKPFERAAILNYQGGNLIELDMAVSGLNSNLASINDTYVNLLHLSTQPPAVLANMPNLAPNLIAFDGIANGELRGLSQLAKNMDIINTQYDTWHKNGGLKEFSTLRDDQKDFAVNAESVHLNANENALATAGKYIAAWHEQLRRSNEIMGQVLNPSLSFSGFGPPPTANSPIGNITVFKPAEATAPASASSSAAAPNNSQQPLSPDKIPAYLSQAVKPNETSKTSQ